MVFRKRVCSLFLALVFVFSLAPQAAFAVDLDLKSGGAESGEASLSVDSSATLEAGQSAVPVVFTGFAADTLRGLQVKDQDGKVVEPLTDKEKDTVLYGSYLLAPGTYSYSFHDAEEQYQDLEAQSFTVSAQSEKLEIALKLTEVETADDGDPAAENGKAVEAGKTDGEKRSDTPDAPEDAKDPDVSKDDTSRDSDQEGAGDSGKAPDETGKAAEEPSPVPVVFVCDEADDLSGLTVTDGEEQVVDPVHDDKTGEAVFGSYLLVPGEYRYSFHDEGGKFQDAEDTLHVEGSEDLTVALSLTPVKQGMSFSFSFVNPIYADVIDESDLPEVPVTPEESLERLEQSLSSNDSINSRLKRRFLAANTIPTFESEEDAAQFVKTALLNRKETISFRINSKLEASSANYQQLGLQILYGAFEHTGVSTEGDYIRYEYGGINDTGSGSISSTGDAGVSCFEYVLAPLYFTTLEQEKELTAKINSILASLDLTGRADYDKVQAIYDYICTHVSYDNVRLRDDNYKLKYTAYDALINGTAVCQGYAVSLYRLCLEAGVDARIVTSASMGHAWNIVRAGSRYYYLDATWDEKNASSGYKYFLKGSKNWQGEHTLGDEFIDGVKGFDAYNVSEDDFVRPDAIINSVSLVLDGMIRIKYYFTFSDSMKSMEGCYAAFYHGDEEISRTTELSKTDGDRNILYYNVIAQELSSDVTVRLFDASDNPISLHSAKGTDYTKGFTYSAMTYARQLQTSSENPYMRKLAKALEDYATAGQIYFKYGDYSGLSVSDEVKAVTAKQLGAHALATSGNKPAGITKTSFSVMSESDNSMRIYFTYDGSKERDAYTYTIDGHSAELVRRSDGSYYITVKNIAAQDLEVVHDFTVSDGKDSYTISSSVLGYANLSLEYGEAIRNLGKALYLYNQAADAYFANKQ